MGVVCAQGRRPSRLKALLQVTVWVLHSRLRVELRDVTKRQLSRRGRTIFTPSPLEGEGWGEGGITNGALGCERMRHALKKVFGFLERLAHTQFRSHRV